MNPDFTIPKNVGIAIVAPGGYAPDETALARGIGLLEQHGCLVHNYYDPAAKHQRFGGTDQMRAAQLHAAADNPDVQIVMALRGGYGMTRILPMLDLPMLAASGKLFVGHSDFTALQLALLTQTGRASFAGPMICDDFTRDEPSAFTMGHFWRCLSESSYTITAETETNPAINESGLLWGGNLAMLTHLVGTPYFLQIDNGILFIEDVNEHPYRVERMLLQLLHAGVLARQKAIIFGDFSSYKLSEYDNGYDFNAMLSYIRSRVAVPVLAGLPFGHIRDKVTLAVGGHTTVLSQKNELQLTMTGYPSLQAVK